MSRIDDDLDTELRALVAPGGEHGARRRHPTGRRPMVAPPPRYYLLFTLVSAMTLLGLVMVLSASSVVAFHDAGSAWIYFNRQAMWTAVGFVALVVVSRVHYQRWRRFVVPVLVVAMVGSMAVFSPLGERVNGARSWINLGGPLRGQPSELLKIALLLYAADLLTRRADRMRDLRATLWPPLLVLGACAAILVAQKDLGTAIVLALIVVSVCFIAGAPMLPLAASVGAMGVLGAILVMSEPYRRARWTAFMDPSSDPADAGYQLMQSLVGFASGGVKGAGVGAGKAKWGFLPEAHTDFIFSVIGEELGLIGVVAVLAFFAAFAVIGVRTAMRAPDRFGMLMAGGVTAWVVGQALINFGAVVGLLPITGLPLPFVSFGGSSLLCTMIATGVLLSVARSSKA